MTKTGKSILSILIVLLATLILVLQCSSTAFAGVEFTTDKNPAYLTVGIAGNPDYYPYESYNSETGEYEGLFPKLYALLSEETGLNFLYTDCGSADNRLTNQKTGYAQIISAYVVNKTEMYKYSMSQYIPVIEYTKDGKTVTIALAFGKYAEQETIDKITEAMKNISAEDISSLLNSYMAEKAEERTNLPFYIVIGVLVLIIAALVFVLKREIQKKQELDKELHKDDGIDPLTGLNNKKTFEIEFKKLSGSQDATYLMAYIGFDIQKVNKYFGESKAEEQLCFAAREISDVANDKNLVARVAGGAFCALNVCSTESEAKFWTGELLDRLNAFASNFESGYKPLFKAGIYRLPSANWDYANAMKIASSSYEIAQKIDADYYIYNEESEKQNVLGEVLTRDFEKALEEHQFIQYLEPIIDNKTAEFVIAEGQARWQHSDIGLMHPSRYLALVTNNEAIFNHDLYMFEESCRKLAAMFRTRNNLKISTDFNFASISAEDFCDKIYEIADKYSFDRSHLIIKISESSLTKDKHIVLANMKAMKKYGFALALDARGNKFSFFADLNDYPVDYIKMDKDVIPSSDDLRSKTFVSSIIDACRAIDIKTIQGGIDSREQRLVAKDMGCDYIQGYFFNIPLSPEEYAKYIK